MTLNSVAVEEFEGAKPVPEGLYKATLIEMKEGSGEFGDYVKLVFEIADGEYKGIVKTSVASLKLSKSKSGKNSKLFDIVKAVLKLEPEPGDNLDLNKLIGKSCQILVENGKKVDDIQYQDISKVLPD